MKKVKIAFAALAVFTAVTTMSFTVTETKSGAALDCWRTQQQHINGDDPNVDQQTECPGLDGNCCYKPDPSNPGEYIDYSFPQM